VFGIAFSIQAIELLYLGSYRNGFILLIGLFFYDVFWVFGSDVMVKVAKSFDAPIKLFFPNPWGIPNEAGEIRPSLLGLGDIVIPGIFIALLLRFELQNGESGRKLEYFYTNLIAYFLGLATTIGCMTFFNAAQPALLYLVPFCLGASWLTAVKRGEWRLLWEFEEKDEKNGKEDKKT